VLPLEIQTALCAAGYREPTEVAPATAAASVRLSDTAKLALSPATKATSRAGEPTIGPARIFHACLQTGPEVEKSVGLSAARARSMLEGAFLDSSLPPRRELSADESLLAFLARLPAGAGSLELLAACHHESTPELSELLLRHKLAPDLLRRAAAELSDPE
jgi:hypothetical protein